MTETAEKSDPGLWEKVKTDVTEGAKGGKPGQWSARKAQLAVAEYKRRGGGYEGAKDENNSLHRWTQEDWGTKSGETSGETGERYLPKEAREALSGRDYARTTAKKRRDTKKGEQFSAQPKDVAGKTAPFRKGGGGQARRDALYAEARRKGVEGRSKMSKAELEKALRTG